MTTSGPKYPSANSVRAFYSGTFNSPANMYAENGSLSSVLVSTGGSLDTSNTHDWTGFGFTTGDIPSGHTIDGIEVTVRAKSYASANATSVINVYIVIDGSTISAAKTFNLSTGVSSLTDFSVGGAADTWGLSTTDAQARASSFGVALKVSGPAYKLVGGNFDCVDIVITHSSPTIDSDGDATSPAATASGSGITENTSAGAATAIAATADGAGITENTSTGTATGGAAIADGAGTTEHASAGGATAPAAEADGIGVSGSSEYLAPLGLTATGTVGAQALTPNAAVTPDGLTATGGVGAPSVSIYVATVGLASVGMVGAPGLSVCVDPAGLTAIGTIDTPVLTPSAVIVPDGLTATGTIEAPAVSSYRGVPTWRRATVAAEVRLVSVAAESRGVIVTAESRLVAIATP